jgi:hypothetical protein
MFMIISSFSIYFLELDNFMIGKRERRGELAKKQLLLPKHRGDEKVAKKSSYCFPDIEDRKGGQESIYMLTIFIYAGSSYCHISQNE